ncbi:MAG TPA: hypothetical protein VE957_01505 [Terriglobales bacterium]|nr:hypothetical protein [Terriglobales bacterium]
MLTVVIRRRLSKGRSVVEGLVRNRSILNFENATFYEMMGILSHSDSHYSLAA